MKAKRYIYLLFALFIGATSLIGGFYLQLSLPYIIVISLVIIVIYYSILALGCLSHIYIRFIDKKISWSKYPVYRLTFNFTLINLGSFILTSVVFSLVKIFWIPSIEYFDLTFWSFTLGGVMALSLIYTIEEAYRFMWRVNNLSLMVEKRKNEQINVKLEALKKQINPHFLFNCFNVLAELVHIDSEKSDAFVTEMGKIYRYVLDQKEDFVVTLSKELEFIESFIFLQQIRFDENLIFKNKIHKTYLNFYIPPLTLEILVENAIKHNKITSDSPLIIEICVDDGILIVKNNYQPRQNVIDSTKIGLKNLEEQYLLISKKQPEFFIKNGSYIARIPLLNP